jgi:hypothetical protein
MAHLVEIVAVRRALLTGACALLVLWATAPQALAQAPAVPALAEGTQADPPDSRTEQERGAIQLVEDWSAAWSSGDPQKVASYVADDVVFSPNFPDELAMESRARLTEVISYFVKMRPRFEVTQTLAVGGSAGTVVLARRIDRFPNNPRPTLNAAFFWIKDGKIRQWYDMPMQPFDAVLDATATAQQEAEAVKFVRTWLASWKATQDAQISASYLAEHVVFSGAYPLALLEQGRDRFINENAFGIVGGVQFHTPEVLAVGGPRGTAVLVRRYDRFNPTGGPAKPDLNAAFFLVRDGRIQVWLDIPVNAAGGFANRPMPGDEHDFGAGNWPGRRVPLPPGTVLPPGIDSPPMP